MDNLVTIRTFDYQSDLAVIRSFLDSEGIDYFIKDEMIGQVYPFSNATGGIKLQVAEEDVERTVNALKTGGFLNDEDLKPSRFMIKLYEFLSKIPFLKKVYS